MSVPPPTRRYVYKIISVSESTAPLPSPLPLALPLSPLDAQDGFIHLSDALQTPLTGSMFFTSEEKLYIAKIELAKEVVGKYMRWGEVEGSPGCAHLYNGKLGSGKEPRLGKEEILEVRSFERGEGEGWEEVLRRKLS